MGTNNPKVSAYVPQVLKNRLKEFRKERDNISESQAVIIILAEYFEIPEVLGRLPEGVVGGVTLARIEGLEKRLDDFTVSIEHRLQQLVEMIVQPNEVLDRIVCGSEQNDGLPSDLQVVHQATEKIEETPVPNQDPEQGSSLLSESPSELPKQENETLKTSQEVGKSVLLGEPKDELPIESANHEQTPLVLEVEKSEEDSTSIDIELLAARLKMTAGSIGNKKSKSTEEEFVKWTADKDIDQIGWKAIKKGKKVYYKPATPLNNELLSRLLAWIKENRK